MKLKNKNLKSILYLFLLVLSVFSVGFSVTSFIQAIADQLTVSNEVAFTFTNNSYTYKAYSVSGFDDGSGKTPVAISWGMDSSATPNNLTIPGDFTYNSANYRVVALADGAFRYCTFTSINLKNAKICDIGREAFMGCEKLLNIEIPHDVTVIKSSTFMDCRALKTVKFLDENNNTTADNTNSTITDIQDHAFASCVAMNGFDFPSTVTHIGQSAFEGCLKLLTVLLPSTELIVDEYAFENCTSMNIMHIPTTVLMMKDYALAGCNRLTIYFMASTIETAEGKFHGSKYRKLYTATASPGVEGNGLVPYVLGYSSVLVDNRYPELIFTTKIGSILITGIDEEYGTGDAVLQESMEYATIIGYIGKNEDNSIFTASNGQIIIPNFIQKTEGGQNYPISVIAKNAFANHTEIKNIVFSENIVKIEERAFPYNTNIASINFEACTKLGEIGSYAFGTDEGSYFNTVCTSLRLPASLKILDGRCFTQFRALTELKFKTQSDVANGRDYNLMAIGRRAFYAAGYNLGIKKLTNNNQTVEIPCSLNDYKLGMLLQNHHYKGGDKTYADLNIDKWNDAYSVAYQAFSENRAFATFRMHKCDCANANHDGNYISYGNQAFCNSYYKTFVSSISLYRLHVNSFKGCGYLQAAILHADKGYLSTTDCWGTDLTATPSGDYPLQIAWKGCLFGNCPNVVAYVNASKSVMPVRKDTVVWYADGTDKKSTVRGSNYADQENGGNNYYTTNVNGSRFEIPVYYDVDLDAIENIVTDYTKNFHLLERDDYSILTNYCMNNPTLNDGALTVEVDFSKVSQQYPSGYKPIKVIGAYSFANNGKNRRSLRYIKNVPNSVEEIGEGAFYSRVKTSTASTSCFYTRITTESSTSGDNYLKLPSSLKRLGRRAFYNHNFKTIEFTNTSGLEFLGNEVFTCLPQADGTYNNRCEITGVTGFVNNSKFIYENGDIYYIQSNGTYFLMESLPFKNQGNEQLTHTIKDGTVAVAPESLAGDVAGTLELPSSLTTLYAYACAGATYNTVQGYSGASLSNLKYLGYFTGNRSTEAYSVNSDTDVAFASNVYASTYYQDYMYRHGPFKACKNLETINIKEMSSLIATGDYTFADCAKLANLTNSGDLYSYKEYTGNGNYTVLDTNINAGVIDMRQSHNFVRMGAYTFSGCKSIKYFHSPTTKPKNGVVNKNAKSLYYFYDGIFSNTTGVSTLIGEVAIKAYYDYTAYSASSRYKSTAFTQTTVYYYAENADDLIPSGADSINYWTYDGSNTQSFILLKTKAKAQEYFDSLT